MRVILFQPRFVDLVETRIKRQTIRQRARCKAGDELSLRRWFVLPYRSKQAALGESVICKAVQPVVIDIVNGSLQIRVAGEILADPDAFAKADGFAHASEMCDWFENTHGLPFGGELITW